MTYTDIEKKFEGTNFSKPQKLYLITKAWWEFLKEEEKEIERKIVSENVFTYPKDDCPKRVGGHKKGERITDPFDICLIAEDNKEWERWYDLYYAEVCKRGLDKGYNVVIDIDARKAYFEACDLLIDWCFEIAKRHPAFKAALPDDFDVNTVKRNIVYRDKVCELAMKLPGGKV